MKKVIFILALIYVSFGFAVNIYSDLRGYDFGAFKWVDYFFPLNLYIIEDPSEFLLFNVPDGLWMFTLCMIIYLVWNKKRFKFQIGWAVFVLILAIMMEYLQYVWVLKGVFDWMDILTYIFTFFITILIFKILNIRLWQIGKGI